MDQTARLRAEAVSVAYGKNPVITDLSLDIPDGKMTIIIGPNACGKSTFLRGLARLLPLKSGQAMLDGEPVHRQPSRSVARRLAVLPQKPGAPEGLTVRDLVARGRTPHQSALRQWSDIDAQKVDEALAQTSMTHNAHRPLETLSGGQQQRAWIAMALAQDTGILLLDEPTTFLDLPRQIELLKLIQDLCSGTGRTVVMVLHDINLAARFADRIVVMKDGAVFAEGDPASTITAHTMEQAFGFECRIIEDPIFNTPHVIPA